MRTVLIIAHQCEPFERPGSKAGAQRVYQFAKHLPTFGWSAEVICCPTSENEDNSPVSLAGGSVIWPIRETSAPSALSVFRSRRGAGRGAHLLSQGATMIELAVRGDWSATWRTAAENAALERISAGRSGRMPRVDALIGEHSPDAGLRAACSVSRREDIPLLLDFRDPLMYAFGSRTARTVATAIYRRAARPAAMISSVSQDWAREDGRLLRKRAVCVPHGWDEDDYPVNRQWIPSRSTFDIGMYGGVSKKYDLRPVSDGLKLFVDRLDSESRSRVRVRYWGVDGSRLRSEIPLHHVEFVDHGYAEKPELLRSLLTMAVVLLPTFPPGVGPTTATKGLIPSKVNELLPLGVPVIACPGDGAVLDEFIHTTGLGRVVEDSDELARDLMGRFSRWRDGLWAEDTPKVTAEVLRSRTREAAAQALANSLETMIARHG